MTPLIPLIPLTQATDPARAGRKAAALAGLTRAGLPVPDGFGLPADLTDEQADATIPHLLSALTPHAPHGLIARSSALCEDGRHASFAGLYTSRFCPTDPASLQQAVHDVRASAASTTAHAYATARNTAHDPAMAVLIQPAIRPYTAGVLAAQLRRPLRWRIEAIHGLAEPSPAARRPAKSTAATTRPPPPSKPRSSSPAHRTSYGSRPANGSTCRPPAHPTTAPRSAPPQPD